MSMSDIKSHESVYFDELLANYCMAPRGELVSRPGHTAFPLYIPFRWDFPHKEKWPSHTRLQVNY